MPQNRHPGGEFFYGTRVEGYAQQSLLLWVYKASKRSTREIGGRLYISFVDYCSWRGRKVNGDLRFSVSAGFTTASWNTWLDAKCVKGRLAGVPAARLQCWVGDHDYLVCPDGAEGQLERRALLLSVMCKAGSTRANQEEVFWKDMAGTLLSKLYAFRQAAATISQRYFDGEEILFYDLVRSLAELINCMEELVAMFNRFRISWIWPRPRL